MQTERTVFFEPSFPRSNRGQAPRIQVVIPAKAGICFNFNGLWIPACAGMTRRRSAGMAIERASQSTPLPTSPLSGGRRMDGSPLQGEGRGGGRGGYRPDRKVTVWTG